MRVKTTLKLIVAMLFLSQFATAQLTELVLDETLVYGGATHYPLPNGNQTYPGALVNDPFNYDPNDPMSAYPNQVWASYPAYSYLFMKPEIVPEKNWLDFAFPEENIDSNFLAIPITIPAGKRIKYLDFWNQSEADKHVESQDVVIILKNANTSWYFVNWDGITRITAPEQGFGRFDCSDIVTDNLLRNATEIALCRVDRRSRFRVAEFRVALEDDPATTDTDAPVLSGLVTGNVEETQSITGSCNEKATLYMVPAGTNAAIADIQTAAVIKSFVLADEGFEISAWGVTYGDYNIYALDENDNLTDAGVTISIVADETLPVITGITEGEVVLTSWLNFSVSERGRVYLVPNGTTEDSVSITDAAVVSMGVSNDDFVMGTYGAQPIPYVLYAIDLVGNISVASPLITLTAVPTETGLVEMPLFNAELGGANYGTKFNLGRYALNDDFSYDPNDPNVEAPFQGWIAGVDTTHCFANGNWEDVYWKAEFDAPADGMELYALDLWGRKWAGAPDGDLLDDGSAKRAQDLYLLVWNADSSVTWETPGVWAGVSMPVDGAYGRFIFRTSNLPDELLTSAGGIMIKKRPELDGYFHIDEVRLVAALESNERPVANAGDPQTVAPGATVTLDGTGSTDADGDDLTYSWTSVDANITLSDATAAQPTFTAPATEGEYKFILEVNDGKITSSKAVVTITVQSTAVENDVLSALNVYPNPSSNEFFVDLTEMDSNTTLTVFDLRGQVLFSDIADNNSVYEMNLSELANGTYILQITNEELSSFKKIIKK